MSRPTMLHVADRAGVSLKTVSSHRMGVEAARLAFARLDGDDEPPRRVVLPTELVPRGSGEVPPP